MTPGPTASPRRLRKRRPKRSRPEFKWFPGPTPDLNYCHVFKAQSPSSTLTRIAKSRAIQNAIEKCSIETSNGGPTLGRSKPSSRQRRMKKKYQKIARLPQVDLQRHGIHHRTSKDFLQNNLIFFSGTTETEPVRGMIPSGQTTDCRIRSVVTDLEVLDNVHGLHLPGVFTLVPRHQAAEAYPKHFLTQVAEGLAYMEGIKSSNPTQRAKGKRVVCRETHGSKYLTFGAHLKLASPGLGHHLKGLDTHPTHHSNVGKFLRIVERLSTAYLDTASLAAIEAVRHHGTYPGMDCGDGTTSHIWPSMSCGRNVFLSSHMDEDFFFSATTVIAADDDEPHHHPTTGKLKLDSPICNCFCFPEHGVCVALRSGDILLFNPLVYHCVSSRCHPENGDVFCLSMYLKTAIVGGNDNGKQSTGVGKRGEEDWRQQFFWRWNDILNDDGSNAEEDP